jgi:hypothetical protein
MPRRRSRSVTASLLRPKKFQATGKLVEAIASAEAMLAIERKVLPAVHNDIIRLVELAG